MRCRVCDSPALSGRLDLGPQPVSSHFQRSSDAVAPTHDLALGVCTACGVLQLMAPFPYELLVPPFDWITYREPEAHLDAVVDKLQALPGVAKHARTLGLTYKDQTTLDRLNARGFVDTAVLNPRADLGATNPNANIESVQALLTPEAATRWVRRHGPVDLLVVRHILEHAEDTRRLMLAVDALLAPGGHVVIEVPDCTANLERRDYTMIWEEHVAYFTLETLPQVLAPVGLHSLGVDIHPYPFEDVLVLFAQKPTVAKASSEGVPRGAVARNVDLATVYAQAFDGWTTRAKDMCAEATADGRQLAAYGAGHLTCAFLQFHGLAEYFAFVVDDTPHKQGLFLPGSGLPIVPRSRLNAKEIGLCLLGFAPDIEDKVIANNAQFVADGGRFASMFVDSPRSIRRQMRA
ncbi:MAG: class I SAM-dependent methyltransferase [Gammaproteobacteria bacterium]|nr:class I SAM-dependent methyltransferase [Gammaproteobacteria bacterium]